MSPSSTCLSVRGEVISGAVSSGAGLGASEGATKYHRARSCQGVPQGSKLSGVITGLEFVRGYHRARSCQGLSRGSKLSGGTTGLEVVRGYYRAQSCQGYHRAQSCKGVPQGSKLQLHSHKYDSSLRSVTR